jgi:DNA-binding HxlR family transcriptional regulator
VTGFSRPDSAACTSCSARSSHGGTVAKPARKEVVRTPAPVPATPRPTLEELDRLIHERLRLAIVSALAVNETLSFSELKQLLKTTDGNLSVHARKLEEADYVAYRKYFDGRVPKTEYRLTAAGRRALERYLDHMEALIRSTRER